MKRSPSWICSRFKTVLANNLWISMSLIVFPNVTNIRNCLKTDLKNSRLDIVLNCLSLVWIFFFFRLQTEPFKTTLGYGLLLCRSPTPTHPVISTMQPPLAPWTEAITHHGATQVPHPQTALFPLRDQPVVRTVVVPRTTGYWTATSPLKQGTVQLVSHTV